MTSTDPLKSNGGIDSIAHLFLSQSNRNADTMPRRQPPSSTVEEVTDKPVENSTSNEHFVAGEVVLACHLDNARDKARIYADYLRHCDDKIALVNIDDTEAVFVPLQSETQNSDIKTDKPNNPWELDSSEAIVIAQSDDLARNLIPALTEAAYDYDNVLINIDWSFYSRVGELLKYCPRLTLLTTCQDADIISTYKTIKIVSQNLTPQTLDKLELSLFICQAPDSDAADEVYYKLSDTIRNFLDKVIMPAGCSLEQNKPQPATSREPVDIPEAPMQSPSEPSEMFPQQVDIPEIAQAPSKPTEPIACNKSQMLCPIKVENFPQNDAQLSDYLQLALPRWLTTLPTAMAVPLTLPGAIDPAVRILIDATGRLHVMLSSLTANDSIVTRVLAARNWLCENSELIEGNCRQLRIDRNAQVGIVIITGSEITSLPQAIGQLPDLPCQILRLYFLQDKQDRSLVLIPA